MLKGNLNVKNHLILKNAISYLQLFLMLNKIKNSSYLTPFTKNKGVLKVDIFGFKQLALCMVRS